MKIPPKLLNRIKADARQAYPEEACGLLIGKPGGDSVLEVIESPNRAAGSGEFLIDSALHLETQRRARDDGRAIIGVYHSHPSGSAEPSEKDTKGTPNPGFYWLIIALRGGDISKVSVFSEIKEKNDVLERNFVRESLR